MAKKQELEKLEKQNAKLREMLEKERENIAGYKQVSEIQNAFIAVLLNKLEATSDKKVAITQAEVNQAMTKYKVKTTVAVHGWEFYCDTK